MKKHNKSTKDASKSIGIIPVKAAYDDIHAQLLAIAAANYLTGVKHKSVTLINMCDTCIFENLAWYHNISFGPDESFFTLYNVIYYPHYNEKYIADNRTDYIIYIGRPAFDKVNLRLVTGSLEPWALKSYADYLKRWGNLYSEDSNAWHFLAHCSLESDRRMLEKDFKISILCYPAILNPFKIKRTDFQFFTNILI